MAWNSTFNVDKWNNLISNFDLTKLNLLMLYLVCPFLLLSNVIIVNEENSCFVNKQFKDIKVYVGKTKRLINMKYTINLGKCNETCNKVKVFVIWQSTSQIQERKIVSMEPTYTNEFIKSCRCCQFIKWMIV
jgi:formylmethanofuran dehydrogenase subunit D